jgi:hypothetical protein
VRELAEERRRADDDVDTVDTWSSERAVCQQAGQHLPTTSDGERTSLDGDPGVIHVAADVSQDPGR